MPLSVQSERVDHTDDAAWKNWRKALDKLHRNDLERKEKESRDLAEKHAREAEEEAAKALATLKDARRREDEAAQTKCERWAHIVYERERGLHSGATYYYMTGDLCMKTLHTDKDQPADQSKRPRESPVEYVWKKETRRVDGPDEQRKLEEGEWELAEWVRYIKNKYV